MAVIVALAVWQIGSMIVNTEFLFPSPIAVTARLFTLWQEDGFFTAISNSFIKIVSGFLLGLILGTTLALTAARFSVIEDLLWPFMITVKSVPVASFIVLALMWLTSKELSVFISFLMVIPIIYTNILSGIKNSSHELDKVSTVFRMPIGRRILYIWIPRIKPFMLSACSIALGLSWKAGVAAEIITYKENSIGRNLAIAKNVIEGADLFAWTIIVVLLSLAIEALIKFCSGKAAKIWES